MIAYFLSFIIGFPLIIFLTKGIFEWLSIKNVNYFAGDKYEKFLRHWDNPFYESDQDKIVIEIIDTKRNHEGELWIKFRYLTKQRLHQHEGYYVGGWDKIKNIFEMSKDEFIKEGFIKIQNYERKI